MWQKKQVFILIKYIENYETRELVRKYEVDKYMFLYWYIFVIKVGILPLIGNITMEINKRVHPNKSMSIGKKFAK